MVRTLKYKKGESIHFNDMLSYIQTTEDTGTFIVDKFNKIDYLELKKIPLALSKTFTKADYMYNDRLKIFISSKKLYPKFFYYKVFDLLFKYLDDRNEIILDSPKMFKELKKYEYKFARISKNDVRLQKD